MEGGTVTGIQLVAIAFAAGMLFLTHTALRRSELRGTEYVIWIAVWVGLILVSLFPAQLRSVISPLQVARLLDLVIVGALLFLAGVVFVLNRAVRRLENRIAVLVRNLALNDLAPSDRKASEPETSTPR